jgi:RNA polymerase sigma-70 factor (ECF subfamily)
MISEALRSSLHADMLAAVPQLRAFARSLARNWDLADDLVQQTMLRACDKLHLFQPDSSMIGWLTTILRNLFYSECRRRRREVEDVDGSYAETLVTPAEQTVRAQYRECGQVLAGLPRNLRDPLLLVGVQGRSLAETARTLGCPVGTVKSRLDRGRKRLASLLSISSVDDFITDPLSRSVAIRAEHGRSRQVA